MIDKNFSVKVVIFVLDNNRTIATYDFVMLFEILVQIFDSDGCASTNFFADSWQTEATFACARCCFAFLNNMCVDEHTFEILYFRIVLNTWSRIDYKKTYILADLWRRNADAFSFIHRLVHVCNELLQILVVLGDVFGHLSQNWMSVLNYW